MLNEYIFDNFDIEEDIPQKNLDRAWMNLQSTIPALQISDLRKMTEYQLGAVGKLKVNNRSSE